MIHLEDMLEEASKIRRQSFIVNRSVSQLVYFMNSCIYGENTVGTKRKIYEWYLEKIKDQYTVDPRDKLLKGKDKLLTWGILYLKWCEEHFGESQ